MKIPSLVLKALPLFFFLAASAAAQANPPQRVNFQGRLTDLADNPLNGVYSLTFSLFAAGAGGAPLWSETQPSVPVANGAAETELGASTPIPFAVARSTGLWLQIQVGAEILSPRQPFSSVFYAMNSAQLGGRAYEAFVDTFTAQSIGGLKTFSALHVSSGVTAAHFYGDGSGLTNLSGDNLGNHTAAANLLMGANQITGSGAVTMSSVTATGVGFRGSQVRLATAPGVVISSEASSALGGGVRVSTNVYIVGFASATRYFGDGSGLTGVGGADNLGNHTATAHLNLAGFQLHSVSTMTMSINGLRIAATTAPVSSGLWVTPEGALLTFGLGAGDHAPAARGAGSVDLQTRRMLGADNVAAGAYSTIAGGESNKVLPAATHAFIGAGDRNAVTAGQRGVIAGGYGNALLGSHGFIGGGYGNAVDGAYAALVGGHDNRANSHYSAVLGGYQNRVNDIFSEGAVSLGGSYQTITNSKYALTAGFWVNSAGADGSFTWNDYHATDGNSELVNNVPRRTVFKNRGGFLVTGSTNTTLGAAANRGVLITGGGRVGISTGAPQAALDVVADGAPSAQIWRNSAGVAVASVSAAGVVTAAAFIGDGSGLTGIGGGMANMALGKPVLFEGCVSGPSAPANMTDGNWHTSAGSCETVGASSATAATIDLGAQYFVAASVRLSLYSQTGTIRDIYLRCSDDGLVWGVCGANDQLTPPVIGETYMYTFGGNAFARYLQVFVSAASGYPNDQISVHELKAVRLE